MPSKDSLGKISKPLPRLRSRWSFPPPGHFGLNPKKEISPPRGSSAMGHMIRPWFMLGQWSISLSFSEKKRLRVLSFCGCKSETIFEFKLHFSTKKLGIPPKKGGPPPLRLVFRPVSLVGPLLSWFFPWKLSAWKKTNLFTSLKIYIVFGMVRIVIRSWIRWSSIYTPQN